MAGHALVNGDTKKNKYFSPPNGSHYHSKPCTEFSKVCCTVSKNHLSVFGVIFITVA